MKNFPGIIITILVTAFILSGCDPVNQAVNDTNPGDINWENGAIIPSPNSQSIPDTVATLYQSDAQIMAAETINKQDSTQINVPLNLVKLYYNGLLNIYESGNSYAEEVTRVNAIHTNSPNSAHQLFLTFNHGQQWSTNWKNGKLHTGISAIDNLIQKYSLQYGKYYSYTSLSFDGMVLKSESTLNMYALSNAFKNISEIRNAEPDGNFVDGSNISALITKDHVVYTFDYGSGDCMAGCINHTKWQFNVYKDGTVTFVKKWSN